MNVLPRESAAVESASATDFRQYYQNFDDLALQQEFQDLDDPNVLDAGLSALKSCSTTSYVVDMGKDAAWAAFDLTAASVSCLLNSDRPESLTTRWINIFYPERSKHLIETIAKRYDFSPRLLAMLSSDSWQARPDSRDTSNPCSLRQAGKSFWTQNLKAHDAAIELEEGPNEHSLDQSAPTRSSLDHGNIYRIANELWHYTSIDFGRSYICIGYNSLYGTKCAVPMDESEEGFLHQVTRVWTWLVICEDSTVISITEDLFPFAHDHWSEMQQHISTEVRRNLANVFRSLSMAEMNVLQTQNPMALLRIRMRVGSTIEETVHRESDTPGLLFYYLFENWHNSYTLITRRESRFGVELAKLRLDMFRAPRLHHIDRLDKLGRELGLLQRHYTAYNRIIERLLEPQGVTAASLHNSQIMNDAASRVSSETVRPLEVITERESMLGVSISSAARARFRRLKDLIDLYALNEVEEYLKQKDALVAMNFNLIAIKESLDVEKLTRITLFLTKATFLFLPVSLVIGYFSIDLVGIEYTVAQFWTAASIMLVLSFTALSVFGLWSGSMQSFIWLEPIRLRLARYLKSRREVRAE
nr:hypothetical protein CFP56_32455 [Quercus suber]